MQSCAVQWLAVGSIVWLDSIMHAARLACHYGRIKPAISQRRGVQQDKRSEPAARRKMTYPAPASAGAAQRKSRPNNARCLGADQKQEQWSAMRRRSSRLGLFFYGAERRS